MIYEVPDIRNGLKNLAKSPSKNETNIGRNTKTAMFIIPEALIG
jgi:hypothetical protein